MNSRIIALGAALLMGASSLLAAQPATLSGHWVSDPAESRDSRGYITAVYDLDLGSTASISGPCTFKAVMNLDRYQLGSKDLKVAATVDVAGKGFWKLSDGDLKITFEPGAVKATANRSSLDLQVPPAMKKAMEVRLDEIAAGILGGIEDGLTSSLTSDGVTFSFLDVPEGDSSVMNGKTKDTPVTLHSK